MSWRSLAMDLPLQRQILAIIAFSASNLMISFSMGFASPAVPMIEKDPSFYMDSEDASWIASAVPGFALLSSLFMGSLVQRVGRKFIMLISSLCFFLSWAGIEKAENIDDLIAYRALCGIAVGAQAVVGSVYQSELIHYTMQGKLVMIPAFLGNVGMLLVLASGQFLDWRGIARFGCYLSIPLLMYLYLPESPYYLISTRRTKAAFKALTWLRGNESLANQEIEEQTVPQETKQAPRVGITEAFEPPHRWGVGIALLLHMGQQATGIIAITLYSTQVFEQLGSYLSPSTCSIILQLVNVCGLISQLVFVGKKQRRSLIDSSSMIILLSLFSLFVYIGFMNVGKYFGVFGQQPNIIFGWLPIILLSMYQIGFNIGWGPVPWIFLMEGLSYGSRGTGTSLAIATNWISTFVVAKTFLYLLEGSSIFFVLLCYFTTTLLFFISIHFFMPETENVKPKDINQIYIDSYIRTRIIVNGR